MIKTLFTLVAALALSVPANTFAQSLWHDEVSRPMFADKRATSVGDIITIVVSETSSASKNNQTKTEKNSSLQHLITPSSATVGYWSASTRFLSRLWRSGHYG